MKKKTRLKRTSIIATIVILSMAGLYIYLNRYDWVITETLAKIGFTNAQLRMGAYCFHGTGFEPDRDALEDAIYWWEKASAKGNEDAKRELANAKQLLSEFEKL